MYIQKLTGRPIEGPELIGNVPLIHHLYEVINLKNKYWIKLCMKCCTLSHCWGIYALCSRRSKCPSDILPYDHRALCAMACHGLVFLIFKTRFLASFLFLLQGVLLGWASRNSLSVFIKKRNPISKSFPKEFLSYYEKIMSQTWQMSRLGKF